MNSSESKQSGWIEDGYSITPVKYFEIQEDTKSHILKFLTGLRPYDLIDLFSSLLEDHEPEGDHENCYSCKIQSYAISWGVEWYAYCECGHRSSIHYAIKDFKCKEEDCTCLDLKVVKYNRAFFREDNYV